MSFLAREETNHYAGAQQGYTAVGGTNWIDVDTTVYNKSLVLTYNYAYGGATINASLVAPYEPSVLSLVDQVNEFLGTVAGRPPSTPWTTGDSLFSFWIGINDIGNSYYESGDRDACVCSGLEGRGVTLTVALFAGQVL